MGENIQSISQGTYTIGQSSATNFVAGPGISITQPSGGTVRIGNDETVLWSGSWVPGNGAGVTNSAIEVSESVLNFEYIRIVTEGILCQVITVSPIDLKAFICLPESDTKSNILGLYISKDDDTHIRFKCGYSTKVVDSYRSNQDWGYFRLMKIIGINRISGSNA